MFKYKYHIHNVDNKIIEKGFAFAKNREHVFDKLATIFKNKDFSVCMNRTDRKLFNNGYNITSNLNINYKKLIEP